MCIIIAKNKDKILDSEIYEESFRCNKDGGGIAYVKDKKLVVDKGFFAFGPMYEEIKKYEQQEMIIHFRIGNRGMLNKENCHPFLVECGEDFPHMSFAIAHNGTLDWRSTATKSDTMCFVEDIIGCELRRDPWFLDFLPGVVLLEKFLGYFNKMVIMRYDSEADETKTYVLNEKAGNIHQGCWFSNLSWKKWEPAAHDVWEGYGHGYGMAGMGTVAGWRPKQEPAMILGGKITPYAEYCIRKSEESKKKVRQEIDKLMGKVFDDAVAEYDRISKLGPYKKVLSLMGSEDKAKVQSELDSQTEIDNWEYAPPDLKHLTKKQRKHLLRLANDILKLKRPQINSRGFTQTERISWLRNEAQEIFPQLKTCKPEDVDKVLAEDIYDVEDFLLVTAPGS